MSCALSGVLCLSGKEFSDFGNYFFNNRHLGSVGSSKKRLESMTLSKVGFGLVYREPKVGMPSLKDELIFRGMNLRPDAAGQGPVLSFRKSKSSKQLEIGKKFFIRFKKYLNSIEDMSSIAIPDVHYFFEDHQGAASLWIEIVRVADDGLSLEVNVGGGSKTDSKPDCETFILRAQEIENNREWFLGKNKVDASFPVKQKMRRIGKDLFLVMHGGPEYLYAAAKERFDFSDEQGENYCRFMSVGEYLLWDGEAWVHKEPKSDSSSFPILYLKRMDEKCAVFELWDIGGIRKQILNLIRYPQPATECEDLTAEIEYAGLKTWNSPTIVTTTGQRFSLNSNEWLLRSSSGWRKIESAHELEEYLSGKLMEPLFVFDGMEKDGNTYLLKGHMFSASRSSVFPVILRLKHQSVAFGDMTHSSGVYRSAEDKSTFNRDIEVGK
ncbi:MAG: hypothetical protein RRZ67_01320 [Victivallaceae bacterium]